MRTAGLVLDFYDDPDKSTLKEAFPTLEEVPEIVKTAHYLAPEEHAVLRDEAYALILQNEGRTLRKFACVDEGNTLLSALYLEANAAKLPEEAIKVAAANLLGAFEQFGLEPTQFLKTAAKKNIKRERDPMMEQYVGDEADWAQRTNLNSIEGSQPSGRVQESAAVMKTASARTVDVTGLAPVGVTKTASVGHLALGTYPLDSFADVEDAVGFFEENWTSLDPAERHEYAVKTASRADDLGIQTTDLLDRYGATDYAPDADAHLASRMAIVQEPELRGIYRDLREKRASIEPEMFAELLGQVDELAGLNWSYGGEVADPYFAVFGGRGKEKQASWLYNDGMGLVCNENQLKYLAEYGRMTMLQHFGDDLVNAFQKNPVQIFDSLPADTKKILARMAISNSEKTASHGMELAGLGILAAPHLYNAATGKSVSHKTERNAELAGLGVLAAPSAYAVGKSLLKKIR